MIKSVPPSIRTELLPLPPLPFLVPALPRLIHATAMLLPIEPLPLIRRLVWPEVLPIALLLISDIGAVIHPAIGPVKRALSAHLVVLPETLKLPPIFPQVSPPSVDLVVLKIAFV